MRVYSKTMMFVRAIERKFVSPSSVQFLMTHKNIKWVRPSCGAWESEKCQHRNPLRSFSRGNETAENHAQPHNHRVPIIIVIMLRRRLYCSLTERTASNRMCVCNSSSSNTNEAAVLFRFGIALRCRFVRVDRHPSLGLFSTSTSRIRFPYSARLV